MIKCGICQNTIDENDYRWTAAFRQENSLGDDGFDAQFCSVKCFLVAAGNVENAELEAKLKSLNMELEDGERETIMWTSAALFVGTQTNRRSTPGRGYHKKGKE